MLKTILRGLCWLSLVNNVIGRNSCNNMLNQTLCRNFMDGGCVWCYNSTNGSCLDSNYCNNYYNYNCTNMNIKQYECSFLNVIFLGITLILMGFGTAIIVGLFILYYYPDRKLTNNNKLFMGCVGIIIMICNIIFLYFYNNYFEKYLVVLAAIITALLILLWTNKLDNTRYVELNT